MTRPAWHHFLGRQADLVGHDFAQNVHHRLISLHDPALLPLQGVGSSIAFPKSDALQLH